MRLLTLLSLLALAACATDDQATGTSNPGVVTPAEAPPATGASGGEVPGDSTLILSE